MFPGGVDRISHLNPALLFAISPILSEVGIVGILLTLVQAKAEAVLAAAPSRIVASAMAAAATCA
jgi:hypothetical protein